MVAGPSPPQTTTPFWKHPTTNITTNATRRSFWNYFGAILALVLVIVAVGMISLLLRCVLPREDDSDLHNVGRPGSSVSLEEWELPQRVTRPEAARIQESTTARAIAPSQELHHQQAYDRDTSPDRNWTWTWTDWTRKQMELATTGSWSKTHSGAYLANVRPVAPALAVAAPYTSPHQHHQPLINKHRGQTGSGIIARNRLPRPCDAYLDLETFVVGPRGLPEQRQTLRQRGLTGTSVPWRAVGMSYLTASRLSQVYEASSLLTVMHNSARETCRRERFSTATMRIGCDISCAIFRSFKPHAVEIQAGCRRRRCTLLVHDNRLLRLAGPFELPAARP
ncbi:hypothetical protein BKA63DRAFT_485095 [Paraphoma chrysanthemicola]|nr:hypothetical protein BKA63DRAFT_485095 [Paraphoma chrysanthemicola]